MTSTKPSIEKDQAISLDEALHRAGRQAFANIGGEDGPGQIGLEQEFFAIALDGAGKPAGRVPLEGPGGIYESFDRLVIEGGCLQLQPGPAGLTREFRLRNEGRITFEPGGQIEHSTTVHPTAFAALEDVREVHESLARALGREGKVLAAAGTDLWHPVEDIPLMLHGGRYQAMADYFDQRGPWGRVMMRHSASVQLNLDFGPEGVWQERWRLANLMAPFILATFAASPGAEGPSTRGIAWQRLDPTRTGFPPELVLGAGEDPRDEWARAALDADVLLFKKDGDAWGTGEVGFSFRDWIERGHPVHGRPTAADLDYHLSTLFFEVRPRGFLELRSCESLPQRWRPAPVVLVTALLYDARARREALALLEGVRSDLPGLLRRAARTGLRDPQLGPLAAQLWELALDGVSRLPVDYFGVDAVSTARQFLERYTFQGRMPADQLTELLAQSPRKALGWATGRRERCLRTTPALPTRFAGAGEPAMTCACRQA